MGNWAFLMGICFEWGDGNSLRNMLMLMLIFT
jgi:hypothetical protein